MSEYNEAPISFNVKAISPSGFDCMLTIRGGEGADLMPKALKALEWLEGQGFSPSYRRHNGKASTSSGDNGKAPVCPTHGKPMQASKYGGWYCPVKIADDDGTGKAVYCKQKVKA